MLKPATQGTDKPWMGEPDASINPPPAGSAPARELDARRVRQDQQRRLQMAALSATNFVLVSVLLLTYAALGSVGWQWPLVYAAVSLGGSALFTAVVYSGRNLRMADPNLFGPQMGFAALVLFGAFAAMPELTGAHLCNLFVTAIFSAVQFNPQQAQRATWVASLGAGAALAWGGERVALPANQPLELALLWVYLTLSLVRFRLIAEHVGTLRGKLREKNDALEASIAHVTHLVEHDALTGLLSRRAVAERLETLRARWHQGPHLRHSAQEMPCVALLDLDHFKRVNDRHGHAVGDEVLKRFAQIAGTVLRKQDALGRWGGEEFVLVLPACTLTQAVRLIDRIHEALAGYAWDTMAPTLSVTMSVGVARLQPGDTVESWLQRADAAAYAAKAAGRNQTVKADDTLAQD